jgi:hypothetical protein
MPLLEWYYNPGTNALASTTILPVTQWKYKFASGAVLATGSSTVVTESSLYFQNSLQSSIQNEIKALTSSTSLIVNAQQYPAGTNNTYFTPLIGNNLEKIVGYIQNAATLSGNFILFAIEIDLDGDFDE